MSVEEVDSLDAYMASLELPSGNHSMAQERAERNTIHSAIRKGRTALVKNRRYRRLRQLLEASSDEDHYFSDGMMQQRSPALFHFYLGQYLGLNKSAPPSKVSEVQTLSSFLMDTCQRSEMETRRVAEQETWGNFICGRKAGAESTGEVEEEEEEEEEEEPTLYSIDERREQLIEIMSSRFLNGEDGAYVDYAEIDADEALDDFDEMQRDAEDRYFAESEVNPVN
ncbi:hypothetical protein PInf_016288 [Phytophthora infestans]|nr:hypothetical protein PInf_016288 [Phytophthora infestans]